MIDRFRGTVAAGARGFGRNWHLVLLLYLVVFLLIPFDPSYPDKGLDPGWQTAVNTAVAQHLAFGRDVVFTFGPYAAVRTGEYHPELPLLGVGGGLLFAAGYAVAVLVLLRGRRRWVAVALSLTAIAGLVTADAATVVYPMLVVLALERITSAEQDPARKWEMLPLAVMAAPLGLLPLMKLSAVPSVAAGMVAATILLVVRRRLSAAAVFCVTPAAAAVLLWLIAGQPLGAMVGYATSTLPLLAGYGEAMSLDGNGTVVALFALAASYFVLILMLSSRLALPERLLVTLIVAATLFVTFKAAFVRHDSHALGTVFPLIVTALAVASYCRSRRVQVTVLLAGLVVAIPVQVIYRVPAEKVPSATVRHVVNGPVALVERLVAPGRFDQRYEAARAEIRARDLIPGLAPGANADIYPLDLASLLAQDVDWNPRPVFHSYVAFTPELARLNADHVRGEGRPDTILFGIGPLDHRLPALEDGASWLPLLENYQLTDFDKDRDYLTLQRRAHPVPLAVSTEPVRVQGELGRTVEVPGSTDSVHGWLATFEVRPTLRGRLRGFVYKSAPMSITVTRADGRTTRHRFIPEMGRSQFLLSPVVRRASAMAGLFDPQNEVAGAVTPQPVRSIRLDSERPGGMWQSDYSFELTAVQLPQ